MQSSHIPRSYLTAFNLFFQLARLQLLRESTPSNWQLASCALEQLAGIWGFLPHPTHLRPLTPDAIKDCSRLFPFGSEEKVGGGGRAYLALDLVNATQPSGINRVQLLPPSIIWLTLATALSRRKSFCTGWEAWNQKVGIVSCFICFRVLYYLKQPSPDWITSFQPNTGKKMISFRQSWEGNTIMVSSSKIKKHIWLCSITSW